MRIRLRMQRKLARIEDQHDLALQLAFVFGKVFLRVQRRQHGLSRHRSVGSRRPRERKADQRCVCRRFQRAIVFLDLPAVPEWPPLLQVHILQSPLLHPLHGPLRGRAMIAAIVHARSIHLGDVEQVLHHLRVLKSLVLDLRQSRQINLVAILFLCWCDSSEEKVMVHAAAAATLK